MYEKTNIHHTKTLFHFQSLNEFLHFLRNILDEAMFVSFHANYFHKSFAERENRIVVFNLTLLYGKSPLAYHLRYKVLQNSLVIVYDKFH